MRFLVFLAHSAIAAGVWVLVIVVIAVLQDVLIGVSHPAAQRRAGTALRGGDDPPEPPLDWREVGVAGTSRVFVYHPQPSAPRKVFFPELVYLMWGITNPMVRH